MRKLLYALMGSFLLFCFFCCNNNYEPSRSNSIKIIKNQYHNCKIFEDPNNRYKFYIIDSLGSLKHVYCTYNNNDSINLVKELVELR